MIESWLELACAVAGARQANASTAAIGIRDIGFTLAAAVGFAAHADAAVTARSPHREAGPGGRRGALAQAHGAGRPRAAGRRRPVVVAARGVARAPEGRADRARGDGRDRLPGDAHAGRNTGRALEALWPLRHRRALQAARPQGRRARPRPEPRGDAHVPHGEHRALVPRPAADALPLPDQGPR